MTEASAQSVESKAASDRLGLETQLVGSVPDLPSAAVTPAKGPIGRGHRAGMELPGADQLEEVPSCHEPGLAAV